MRIPRFYCPAAVRASQGDVVELDPGESRHLGLVLRRAAGDVVRILPGDGREWEGTLVSVEPGRPAGVRLERRVEPEKEARRGEERGKEEWEGWGRRDNVEVVVGVALARGGAFELALEHLAELGADEIVPLLCARCVVRLSDARDADRKRDRWMRVLEGAAKQSGRRVLPRLAPPVEWKPWVERELAGDEFADRPGGKPTEDGGDGSAQESTGRLTKRLTASSCLWVATPDDSPRSLFEEVAEWLSFRPTPDMRPEALAAWEPSDPGIPPRADSADSKASLSGVDPDAEVLSRPRRRVVCAIGPEGGLTPDEVEFALRRGASPAWLGDHVLRVPTAAAASMTAIRLAIRHAGPYP